MTETIGRRVTLREFLISELFSAIAGVIFTWLFAHGRVPASNVQLVAFGVVAGVVIGIPFTFAEQLFGPLILRLRPSLRVLARAVLYFGAAIVGFGFAFPIAGLVVFGQPVLLSMQFPILVSATAASLIAMAIYSYQIMKERLEASLDRIKEQEFAERELELARSIQQRLLPSPEIDGDGYRVVARNIAATYVAGDFYDVFHLADGTLGLAVADVAGKGMGASLIMSSAKAMLPLLATGRSTEQTIRALNARLLNDLGKREFVALALVFYDPPTGRASIANAGLPDPFLIGSDGLRELVVTGPRIPLGMMKDIAYESIDATLAPGDRLMIFSDGLPEAPTGGDTQLGYEKLQQIVNEERGASAAEWIDAVIKRIDDLTPDGPDDDCTVLVLERTKTSRPSPQS